MVFYLLLMCYQKRYSFHGQISLDIFEVAQHVFNICIFEKVFSKCGKHVQNMWEEMFRNMYRKGSENNGKRTCLKHVQKYFKQCSTNNKNQF